MQMKTKHRLILGILLSTFILIAVPQPSQAFMLRSNLLSGTPPTIDGVTPAGEWSEAYTNVVPCPDASNPASILQVTLKAMNDGSNLYFLVQWADTTHNADVDAVWLCFDEDHDNNFRLPAQSENVAVVRLSFTGTTQVEYLDGYGGTPHWDPDVNGTHGAASGSWSPNQYTVEIRVPLGASDQEDLQTVAGEIIGLTLCFAESTGWTNYEFPFDTWMNYYSNPFQLAATASIGTPTLFLVLLTLGLLALLMTWKKYTLPK